MPRDVLYEIRFRNKRNKDLRLTIMPPDNVPFPVAPVIKTLHVDAVNAISSTGTPFDPVMSGNNKYEGLPLGFPLIPTLKLSLDLDKFDALDNDLKDLREYLINPIVAATNGLYKGEGLPVELTPIFTLYDAENKILFRGVIRRDPKSKYTFSRNKLPFEINLAHIFRVVLESTRIEDATTEYEILAAAQPQYAPRVVRRIYDFAYWSSGKSGVVAQAHIGKYGNSQVEMIPYAAYQQAMFTQAQKIYRQFMRNPTARFFADNTVFAGIDFFHQHYNSSEYDPLTMPKSYDELFALVGTPAWQHLPYDGLYFAGYEYIGSGSGSQRPASTTGMLTDMEGGFVDKGDAWTLLSRFVNGLGRKATVVYGYNDDLIAVFYPYGKSLFITKTSVPISVGGTSTISLHHYLEPPTIEEGAEIVSGVEITTKYIEEDAADKTQHRIELEGSENDENWSAELVLNNMPMVGKSDMSDRAKGDPSGDFSTANVAVVHWKGYNRTGLFYFAKPDFASDNLCFRVNDVVGIDAEYVSKRPGVLYLPDYNYVKDNWESARRNFRDAAIALQGSSCLGLSVGGFIMGRFTSSENTVTSTADGLFAVKVLSTAPLATGLPGVVIDGQTIALNDNVFFQELNGVFVMTATGFITNYDANTAANVVITSGTHLNEIWSLYNSFDEYGIPTQVWTLSGIAEPVITTKVIPKRGFMLTAKIANDILESTYIQEGVPVTERYNLVDLSRIGERYNVDRLRTYLTQIPEHGILTNVDSDYIADTNSINILLF
jgi:hypothetical protein